MVEKSKHNSRFERIGAIRWRRVLVANGNIDNTFDGYVHKASSKSAAQPEKKCAAIERISKIGEYVVDASRIRRLVREQEEPCLENVVKYYALEEDQDFWYLAMEKFDHTLETYVHTLWKMTCHSNTIRYVRTTLNACRQAAQGLQYLHEKFNWIHGDITPSSLLIRPSNTDIWRPVCKISHAGLRKRIGDGHLSLSTKLDYRTLCWLPPELLENPSKCSQKSDVWALGCVVFYALTGGRHPFGENLAERIINISSGKMHLEPARQQNTLQHAVTNDLMATLISMMDRIPQQRPKLDQKLVNALNPLNARQQNTLQHVVTNDLMATLNSMMDHMPQQRPKLDQKLVNTLNPRGTKVTQIEAQPKISNYFVNIVFSVCLLIISTQITVIRVTVKYTARLIHITFVELKRIREKMRPPSAMQVSYMNGNLLAVEGVANSEGSNLESPFVAKDTIS